MDPPALLTIQRAAHLLGVSTDQVRRLIRQGRLGGVREGRVWHISVESLRALLEEREEVAERRSRVVSAQMDALARTWRLTGQTPDQTG